MSEQSTESASGRLLGVRQNARGRGRVRMHARLRLARRQIEQSGSHGGAPSQTVAVYLLASGAALSIVIAISLLSGPFSAAHGFAGAGGLLCLLAVHRALFHAGTEAARGTGGSNLAEFGNRIERRIEQLKDLQWEISENEARYRDLLDSQDDMILRRDAAGRLTFVNKAFCRAFGIEPGAALGLPFSPEILACEGPRRAEQPTELRRRRFVELVGTTSGPRWIEWEEQSVPSAAGVDEEVQSIGRDVTQARRARAELEEARDRAEAASRAKSRFLAAMSHEIRTPMNGILGMSSLLLESCEAPDQQTYARAIDQSARNLLVVIDEILDYSKIEAGKLLLSHAPFRIDTAIQSVVELMAPRAHEKGLEIAWSVEPGFACLLSGDEARFRQILLNLLSNAVKFTDAGGVLISARRVERAGVSKVAIAVQDTGIGLSQDDKKRLFDEFEQADAAIKRQSGGTGLGLAISRQLARAMGGDIHVVSSPGKGSTFTVDLDLKAVEAPAELPADDAPGTDALTVLLAFDRPLERRTLATALAAAGITTIETAFADALQALRSQAQSGRPVDRVVVETGVEPAAAARVLAAARELAGEARDVRGVVLVNVLSRSRLSVFRAHGFNSYLVRPVRPASMLEQLGVHRRRTVASHKGTASEPAPRLFAQPRRVLLAEDNDINELLARRILESCGCEVVTVRTGLQAVDIMRSVMNGTVEPFALILMDILMPGLDGVEATQRIKELFAGEAGRQAALPPIVALTANAFVEDRQRYLEAGMDDYLAKPFEKQGLERLLARWLGGATGGKAA